MIKKAICLAGGKGTRLHPLTKTTSKQLLPLYNKPVIAFPLQTLKSMGYDDILIITADEAQMLSYKGLLGDGSKFGLKLSYVIQGEPRGLADAFIVGEDHIKNADEICMILGDNIIIDSNPINATPNTIFTYKVKNPEAYGVVTIDDNGGIDEIIEKPQEYVSDDAVIGLYIFKNNVVDLAKQLKPSKRGEIEIVDLIKLVNQEERVKIQRLDGFWFDVGDFDSLLDCANLVRTIDKRSNHDIGLVGI